jgi:hypothetical protein
LQPLLWDTMHLFAPNADAPDPSLTERFAPIAGT